MQYTADVVHPKAKSTGAVQWAHSSLSRILSRIPVVPNPLSRILAFSPDGHWLAYGSNELGTNEIYLRPFPGLGGRWQVSAEGGRNVSWSRDGRELLFESFDRRVMTVAYIAKGDSFRSREAAGVGGASAPAHQWHLQLRTRARWQAHGGDPG